MNRRIIDCLRPRSLRCAVPVALFTLSSLACHGGTEPRRAVALALVTQPPSSARSGAPLSQAPVIELRDRGGAPFAQANVAVTVSIASGGGTLGGATTRTTDAEGRITFSDLVINGMVGSHALSFAAAQLAAAVSTPITLAAGVAAVLEAATPPALQAVVNTAVANPPSVVVKDASGNPVSGVSVTYAVANGAGTLTGAVQSSSASGAATLGGWTLPSAAGQYALTATAAGVPGNGVAFSATATPDAPNAMRPSGSGQSRIYGSRLDTPLQVRVVDQYGNPTPGVMVTWSSIAGAGTVEPLNAATDADGIVRSNYRLGTTPGANQVLATISSRSLTAEFTATALGFSDQFGVDFYHGCALDVTGVAYCWGDNDEGQLGDGTTTSRLTPGPVAGGLRFRRLSIGRDMTCALTTENLPYCWGSNAYAALGDGTQTDRVVPTPVSGGYHFVDIATAGQLSCGITAVGAAYCWGDNGTGQLGSGSDTVETCTDRLGNPDFPCSRVPVAVAGGYSFAAITAGANHACGLTAAGDLYCWGFSYDFGENGIGGLDASPVLAATGFTFTEATAGGGHTCGIVAPSSAYCWGNASQFGVIGNGTTNQTQATPALVQGITAAHVDAGFAGTCAVATDGSAFCWGFNAYGGLGDGTTTDRTTPVAVAGGLSFTNVITNTYATCGRVTNGQLYCWGDNTHQALGTTDDASHLTPALVHP